MSEAIYLRDECEFRKTAAAAIVAGEVHQNSNGRAMVYTGLAPAVSGDRTNWREEGIFTVPKTVGVVITDGQEVFWDHSANSATFKTANDRDFFLGSAVGDAASADTTIAVNINVKPRYLIDLQADPFLTTVVKTVVGSTTVEIPHVEAHGGAQHLILGTTAEAQKVDLLSEQAFAVGSKWIAEFVCNVLTNSDNAAGDFSLGLANATHASDADAIAESCFIHTNGADLNLYAESDDGTTEVNATDTTVDFVVGTPFHVVIDGRNLADLQIYIDGVLILGSTVFKLDAATGPLKLLAHLEKTADDSPGTYAINRMRVRTMQQ